MVEMSCIIFLLFIAQIVKGDDIVHTDSGPVRGKTVASGRVEAFLGIPYAEPPVGSLRFAKPVPKASWEDVYEATQLPPPCIQLNLGKVYYAPDVTNMSEDCLYLNIWVPRRNTEELKPVMLFIHGGAFFFGSSNMALYDGTKLSEHGDVVVVTINYRVGGLGFFAGFNDEAPGSAGLYDQVTAMQWVKNNAKHFGGDPDRIVLFGESAGAFSTSMHQISPISKHLFRRAILQSGSAINPMNSQDNKHISKASAEYAQLLGCTSGTMTLESKPDEVVDCLKHIPAKNFAKVDTEILQKFSLLSPRIGNDFLPKNTIDAYRQGDFQDSEVLIGVSRDEGSMLLTAWSPDVFGIYGEKDVSRVLNDTMTYLAIKALITDKDATEIDEAIFVYLDEVNKDSGYTYLKALSDAVGDLIITCGSVFQAEYHSLRDNPVYFYMFNHRSSSTPHAEWMGVAHAEELQYVFGNPMYEEFTEFEKELSMDIMNMWASFARNGNPTISGGKAWPKYTYQDPKYYIIGKRDRIDVRPDHYRCERWRKHFRSVIDDEFLETLKRN